MTIIADGPSGQTGSVNNNQTSVSLLTDTLTLAGGTGVDTERSGDTITFAIGQDVSTTSNVSFNTLTPTTIAGNVTFTGDPTFNESLFLKEGASGLPRKPSFLQ